MKTIGRSIGIMLSLTMILSSVSVASAAPGNAGNQASELPSKIQVYVKPDVAVTLNGEFLQFSDEKGNTVYPIIYNGSTYLPVRAVSELMGEPIEWVNSAKMVLIGMTLSNPDKQHINTETARYVKTVEYRCEEQGLLAEAYLKPDVKILYDFEEQKFKNVVGAPVYPIIYNGSTYLPLRSAAELMGIDIGWDNETKTVYLEEDVEPVVVRAETQNLIKMFEATEKTYNDSTKDLMKLQSTEAEKLPALAAKISEHYAKAKSNNEKVQAMLETEAFNEDEEEACMLLAGFSALCENYVLVLENIVYMAVQEQDYSVLADVFFDYAVKTQEAMEKAREAIACL